MRQRAKVEKLRQDIDLKKEKEYLLHQEKLVKRLEHLYAQGVKSVGEGHKKASELRQNGKFHCANNFTSLVHLQSVDFGLYLILCTLNNTMFVL